MIDDYETQLGLMIEQLMIKKVDYPIKWSDYIFKTFISLSKK